MTFLTAVTALDIFGLIFYRFYLLFNLFCLILYQSINKFNIMTTSHLIIAFVSIAIILFGGLYLIYSFLKLIKWLSELDSEPDKTEMSSHVRYKQTAELEEEISNNKNQSK